MAAIQFFLLTLISVVAQASCAPTPRASNSTVQTIGNVSGPTPPAINSTVQTNGNVSAPTTSFTVLLAQTYMSGLAFQITQVLWDRADNATAMVSTPFSLKDD